MRHGQTDWMMSAQKPRTIFLLRLLQLNIYNLLVERLIEFELTPLQYMVLSILDSRGSWSTADLARRFHIAPQSMNEIVTSLRKKKLIERRESSEHRRILRIRPTTNGTRLLEACDKAVDRIERAVFRDSTSAEIGHFRDFLNRALVKFTAREGRSSQRGLVSPSANGRSAIAHHDSI
jgi:DNA-binding MarR family transcriptional regulator